MSFELLSTAGGGTGTEIAITQASAGAAITVIDAALTGLNIGTGSITTGSLSTTNPNLLVFRYQFNGASDDTVSVWLNPTAASDVANITATKANFILNYNQLKGRNSGATNDLFYDEIRYGTTFADVVPIPEPSTWALLAGGLGALTIFRRRRHS
jgi:hypothetical protein